MTSLRYFGTRGGDQDIVSKGNYGDSWSMSAALGLGLMVFLYVTAKHNIKLPIASTTGNENEESCESLSVYNFVRTLVRNLVGTFGTMSFRSDNNSALTQARYRVLSKSYQEVQNFVQKQENCQGSVVQLSMYKFFRSIVGTLVRPLGTFSFPSDDDSVLMQARLKALASSHSTRQNFVQRQGSCQCGAVQFNVRAPSTLNVHHVPKNDVSSIQYPQIKIIAEDFNLVRGASCMQSFQSQAASGTGQSTFTAHTFCSRCGVHLLHATKSSNVLHLNALTLRRDKNDEKVIFSFEEKEDFRMLKKGGDVFNDYDNASETKATSQSSSHDDFCFGPLRHELRTLFPPSSPLSEHSAGGNRCLQKQVSSIENNSTTEKDEFDFPFEQYETQSIKSSMSSKSLFSSNQVRGQSKQKDCGSARSCQRKTPLAKLYHDDLSPQRPTTLPSLVPRTGKPYGLNGDLLEVDAQSVASSISENMFSTSNVFDTASIYSRSSSHKAIRSVEQSHDQLRKYLSKHVTETLTSPTSYNATERTPSFTYTGNKLGGIVSPNVVDIVAQFEIPRTDSIDL